MDHGNLLWLLTFLTKLSLLVQFFILKHPKRIILWLLQYFLIHLHISHISKGFYLRTTKVNRIYDKNVVTHLEPVDFVGVRFISLWWGCLSHWLPTRKGNSYPDLVSDAMEPDRGALSSSKTWSGIHWKLQLQFTQNATLHFFHYLSWTYGS